MATGSATTGQVEITTAPRRNRSCGAVFVCVDIFACCKELLLKTDDRLGSCVQRALVLTCSARVRNHRVRR